MKKNRYVILFFFFANFGFAQVKTLVLLSPFAEYTWWDDQSGLKDGTLGGKLVWFFANIWSCVRSIWSTDLKTNFGKYGGFLITYLTHVI
jgi:hypothetical protein